MASILLMPIAGCIINLMKTHTDIWLILLALASGGVGGYLLRAPRADGSLVLSSRDTMREEYLAPPDSFSKVQNTKNALDALSVQWRIGIMDALWAYDRLPKKSESERRKAQRVLEDVILTGEAAVQEFEGTEQQLEVVHGLLLALRKAGQFDRWTEVYLRALYGHPTDPVVSRLANDAVKIGQLAGKQDRVLEALGYVSAMPAAFPGKAEVEMALNSAHPHFSGVLMSQGRAWGGGEFGWRGLLK